MFTAIRKRVRKAGLPPGKAVYTGEKNDLIPKVTLINYSSATFSEQQTNTFTSELLKTFTSGVTWINIEGLRDVALIQEITNYYQIHPLTVEDILNIDQRSKIEEFNHYIFITLKVLDWHPKNHSFSINEISIIFGENFILTFQDGPTNFDSLKQRLRKEVNQKLRSQNSDYLAYRIIDSVVDQYFIVLEGLGDQIQLVEDKIISNPTPNNSRTIYHLKRQMMLSRKAIWPMREVISHMLQIDEKFISPFTRVYIRDVYDHTVQAIDTVETFRDILNSMLDIYLSTLTVRMNEIMKVLTIIATIFIPITCIASIYGMNFKYMPELQYHYGYPIVISIMVAMGIGMLIFFRRKKWL